MDGLRIGHEGNLPHRLHSEIDGQCNLLVAQSRLSTFVKGLHACFKHLGKDGDFAHFGWSAFLIAALCSSVDGAIDGSKGGGGGTPGT